MRMILALACAITLVACSTPPKPPTVSGRKRTDINANDFAAAERVGQDAARVAAEERAKQPPRPQPIPPPISQTVTVYFDFNSTTFRPSPIQMDRLRQLVANDFARIEVRGRTDNKNPAAGDAHVARGRAEAARDWLIGQGVKAQVVSINYVSAGDYASNNRISSGRAMNRRVDIEVFRK